jgi:hypothetical protein
LGKDSQFYRFVFGMDATVDLDGRIANANAMQIYDPTMQVPRIGNKLETGRNIFTAVSAVIAAGPTKNKKVLILASLLLRRRQHARESKWVSGRGCSGEVDQATAG